jgi:hypothetical protein
MAGIDLELSARRMLLTDWFVRLAQESNLDLSQRSSNGERFTIGDQKAFHVIAHFTKEAPFLNFVASDDSRQNLIDEISAKAAGYVEARDFGGVVWYSTELHEVKIEFSPFSVMGPLLQRLGSQTRIADWRRLGTNILLEFVEEIPEGWAEKQPILAPTAVVRVHIAASGPCAGYFSSRMAHDVIETVGAISTFALGRPVQLPHAIFPARDEDVPELDKRRTDPEIPTLARRGTSLDIFSLLAVDGGFDVFKRARAALITFDAAVRQERDSVATILYVVAAECLTTPNTRWRLEKLTKRFIKFFDELMPAELDQIVAHGNFEEAFGIRRGTRTERALRRELLDRIYSYRSEPLHEGLDPSYRGLGVVVDSANEIRRGLLADFAEAAILQYLEAPRVSLVGHPVIDPPEEKPAAPKSS